MSLIKRLLQSTNVGVIAALNATSPVIEINSTETPAAAFQKLLDNDILSAPVLDVETGKYTGFLDLRDLVSFTVYLYDEQQDPNDTLAATRVLDITNPGASVFKNFVDGVNVKYLSRRNVFRSVNETSSLADVCRILALGVKRVPILDATGKVRSIISQSAINRFLVDHTKELHGETSFPLGALTIGQAPVLAVTPETTAIDTFRLMDNKHISGVAVVDSAGHLQANTSSRDLKFFVKNPTRGMLMLNIMEFLAELHQHGEGTRVVTVTEQDTLAEALARMVTSKVHRVYVTRGTTDTPIRVVTLTDVMKYIV